MVVAEVVVLLVAVVLGARKTVCLEAYEVEVEAEVGAE